MRKPNLYCVINKTRSKLDLSMILLEMEDIEVSTEVESDIEICVVDDEDYGGKETMSTVCVKIARDDAICDEETIDEDTDCDQIIASATSTLASVFASKDKCDNIDETKESNRENVDMKELVLSNFDATNLSKKAAETDDSSLLSRTIKAEPLDSRSNSSSSESDYEDEDYCENDDDVFKRFYFESDHLALKHNRDYKNLLKTLMILEAERISSVKDLEELQIWKEKALRDPISFVESLRSKNPPKLPERKQIPAVPTIDWMQYLASSELMDFAHKFKVKTRRSIRSKGDKDKPNGEIKLENGLDNDSESTAFESTLDQGKFIQGRMDEGKTITFNRLWTNEEQEKLEKLLQIYPPEDVEARRWEKIARALGNRTPKQVSSRVQKYFIKLARAGLPIPGRVPHLTTQRKAKINPVSYRNSTFFPSWKPSIYMTEDDDDDTSSVTTVQSDSTPYVSDEEMIPSDLKESAEYKELMHLKRCKREFLQAKAQCSSCSVKHIGGPLYHCADCSEDQPYILCGQCMERNKKQPSLTHPTWHHMVLVGKNSSFVDGDYVSFELQHGKYNYLDPNFTPNVR